MQQLFTIIILVAMALLGLTGCEAPPRITKETSRSTTSETITSPDGKVSKSEVIATSDYEKSETGGRRGLLSGLLGDDVRVTHYSAPAYYGGYPRRRSGWQADWCAPNGVRQWSTCCSGRGCRRCR